MSKEKVFIPTTKGPLELTGHYLFDENTAIIGFEGKASTEKRDKTKKIAVGNYFATYDEAKPASIAMIDARLQWLDTQKANLAVKKAELS